MSSRERRLLDKDIEIRKLQSELKHYKTQFFVAVVEKDNIQKALDIAVDMLTRIAVSPETMMEPEKVVPQLADLALKQITALEQKEHFADTSKKIEQKGKK